MHAGAVSPQHFQVRVDEKVLKQLDESYTLNQSLVWLRAERRFRVVWRGFPRARATLEPAENLMPPGIN